MPPVVVAAGVSVAGSLYASNKQSSAIKRAGNIQKQQLEFDKMRYDKWEAVYGELQEDLGTYYKNLTGENLSNREVEAIQLGSQRAQDNIISTLEQRGLGGSGLEGSLLSQNIYNAELAKADSMATSEQRAMEQKANFLSVGLNKGQAISNSMANTSGKLTELELQKGNNSANTAGAVTGALVSGISGYSNKKVTDEKDSNGVLEQF